MKKVYIHTMNSKGVVPTHALIKYEPDDDHVEFIDVKRVKQFATLVYNLTICYSDSHHDDRQSIAELCEKFIKELE